ncbi:MAG: DUF1559 domain-containing protein [Planctomycetaceae bacterium]|nr:DUF1559 domain-containing protein [Planctomycetaceae bacterium]
MIVVLVVAGIALLVTICVIVAVVLTFWVSGVPQQTGEVKTSTRSTTSDKAKQLAKALVDYERANRQFPPAAFGDGSQPNLSWRVALLPYLNDKLLYTYIRRDKKWNEDTNIAFTIDSHPAFQSEACPESKTSNRTAFVAVVGPNTVLQQGQSHQRRSIADGADFTGVFLEVHESDIAWAEPRDITVDEAVRLIRNCRDPRGLTVGMANGNTIKITPNATEESIRDLFICNDFMSQWRK